MSQVAVAKPGPDYIIGPGDVLDISLWRDDALTKQVVVLPDGKISYPLIGEIIAGGRTIGDLKSEIADKLVPFVPEPVLNVEVKQVNSMLLYVIGRVNSPGRFVLNTNVDVLQALSIAGGLNPFAKRSKIKILRKQGSQTKAFPFDYDEVVDGEKLSQNITLQRGDVIVVP
jgi:polysaccharide export outer membrane protein